jgi:hypothetical protein
VNNDVQEDFPAEQGVLAVWAMIFGFESSFKTIIGLKIRRADFAEQLRPFFAVVVIQILMRCITKRALFGLRDRFPVANSDGFERPAVFGLIGFE